MSPTILFLKRMILKIVLFVVIATLAIFSVCVTVIAETLYPWQVYDDQQLDKTVIVSSSSNVEVGTSGLYSAILSDLNENTDKPVQQFRFTAYLQLTDGAGYVNNSTLRFGNSQVMYADPTPNVQLSTETIVPVAFTVSSPTVLNGSPVLRFYVTTNSGCSFKVVGLSCTAYRLVEQETQVSYDPRIYVVLCIICAVIVSMWILRAFKPLFQI